MLLYIILFIVLQPDLLSKKKGLIHIPEIVLRSFIFIIIVYVFKQYEEGFQISGQPGILPRKGIQISGDAESLQIVGTRANKLYDNVMTYVSNIANYTTTTGAPNFFGNMPTYR
jgi:hypothetical protein